MTAYEVIRLLQLEPLEGEGGYFRRTFESPVKIEHRFAGTAIYYLVTPDGFSALHRLPQYEIFHFYAGDAVEMINIGVDGKLDRFIIGSDLAQGQLPQRVVPGNTWQGTRLLDGGKWGLMGCSVVPGYEDEDNEIGSREKLVGTFPQHREWIEKFTRG